MNAVCSLPVYYGVPRIEDISEIKSKYKCVMVERRHALSHSIIFLRETGFPVYIIGSSVPEKPPEYAKTPVVKAANGWVFKIFAIANDAYEHHELPVSLWRTEASLANRHFPTGIDYITFLQKNAQGVIRLFDFYGDKAGLLSGYFSPEVAKILQQTCLTCFKTPFSVAVPHAEQCGDFARLRQALPYASVGIMLEGECKNTEKLVAEADFVYVGANDLMRTTQNVGEVLRKIGETAVFCAKYEKTLTVCGEFCENPDFFKCLCDFGVQNVCISESKYYRAVKSIKSFT